MNRTHGFFVHPVTRVLCLIALAAGLATAAPAALLCATVLLLGVSRATTPTPRIWLPTLYRLRWIFISLMVLYAWFTPGQALWEALGAFSPTWPGLRQWLLRGWMLWVMAAAARLLMQVTPRDRLIAGLYQLLRPLEWFGAKPERFCLRLVLTLEYALAQRPEMDQPRTGPSRGKLVSRAAALVQARFQAVERQAAQAPLETVTLPACGNPPWYQWAYPMGLLAALWGLSGVAL